MDRLTGALSHEIIREFFWVFAEIRFAVAGLASCFGVLTRNAIGFEEIRENQGEDLCFAG
jgi:hypothetical protein